MPELRVAPTCEALRRLADAGRIDPAAAPNADRRLPLSAPARAPAADGRRRADPPPARRPRRHRTDRDLSRLYRSPMAFAADLTAHLELGRAALRRAVRAGAEPRRTRQPCLHRRRRRSRRPWQPCRELGFADPAAVAALVRSWHHGRMRATRSQRAREILTELVPELLRIFGATPHPDEALRRFDQFLARLPAGVQLLALFSGKPRALGAGRRYHGRGAAACRAVGAAAGFARRGADARVLFRHARAANTRRRSCALARRRSTDFADMLDAAAAMGRRAAVPGRRSAVAPRDRRRGGGRGAGRHRARPRSPHFCRQSRRISRGATDASQAAPSPLSAWVGLAAER